MTEYWFILDEGTSGLRVDIRSFDNEEDAAEHGACVLASKYAAPVRILQMVKTVSPVLNLYLCEQRMHTLKGALVVAAYNEDQARAYFKEATYLPPSKITRLLSSWQENGEPRVLLAFDLELTDDC